MNNTQPTNPTNPTIPTVSETDGYEPDRITVWKHTKERYKDSPVWPSYKFTEMPARPNKRYASTVVDIIKRDMIDEGVEMKSIGLNPLVLNMADWIRAGGCVDAGSGAQEEECFRRSNYFRTLVQDLYPLGNLDTIISKDVEYYRNGAALGYTYMPTTVKLDMIAQPALQCPQITRDQKFLAYEADIALFEEKIHMLFRVAALQGNDSLILSAWGCGAFGCPPYHVAKMFKKILAEYDGVFNEVVFAILGQNYELFKKSWDETD